MQIGRAAPQSELSRHATHWPVAAKHLGAAPGQSESSPQATHWPVPALQILLLPVQSVAVRQPTQAPLESQSGAFLGHTVAMLAVVQAAWHWWSAGQHDGADAGQSVFAPQAAHCPRLVTQIGVGCAQSRFSSHSTHPSVGSHFWLARHWSVPLTPQSALPGPSPLLLAPLHAISAATATAAKKPQGALALLMVLDR